MKLGVFDSGLGGLLISKAIADHMPDLDILYFGDTLHLPYGNRSDAAIMAYTQRAMDAMFERGCSLIVIACNTASASCLRALQQSYLPKKWPGRNSIGVVVPTLEAAIDQGSSQLGLIATNAIVGSNIYAEELTKLKSDIELQQVATPLLVPLIENGGEAYLKPALEQYLKAFDLDVLESLILGCTHYPRLKGLVKECVGANVSVLSQDEIIPAKLESYLERHPEYEIGRNGTHEFYVSDVTSHYINAARDLYGSNIVIERLET